MTADMHELEVETSISKSPSVILTGFVRIHLRMVQRKTTNLDVSIQRALWYAAGQPARLDLVQVGHWVYLVPVELPAGLSVLHSYGIVRTTMNRYRDQLVPFTGYHAAELAGRMIRFRAAKGSPRP